MRKPKDVNKWIGIEEAVRMIMDATGKTRRQARAALIELCRQGEVRASGVNVKTGEREPIPPKAFPIIN